MLSYESLLKFGRRLMAGAAAVSLAGCATAAPEAAEVASGKPALWKLADADTTIYLFGTIHTLPEGVKWRTPVLDRAMAAADTLVLETTISGDMMATAQTMAKLGVSPGLPPLLERVPVEKRAALAETIKASGVPAQALDRLETWAAAMTLMALQLQQMGLNPELGVEKVLDTDVKGSKKVVGLETVEQQLGFFDQLSEPAQRAFLASAADDPEAAKGQFEAMLKAWSSGDVEGIARTFDSETALSPELREVLIKRRNVAWAEWLQKRLDQPGTVMVAVGAGHLAGPDSVQRMLAARGLKAERVQ